MAQTKSIKELRETWVANQEGFRTQELGRLQDFVRDVFESRQLFALTYGDLRRDNSKRKNEFTRETTKEGASRGRADMVIFIDGEDIVIPVEVEKLGNIRAGESQILQYQTDWRKKYGILTDGREWRLYFDRWYEAFQLEDILNKKSNFWEKWEQYISPETYYDMAFNTKGQQELFETERLDPCTAENRPFFFNDITNLLRTFETKIIALFPLIAGEERQTIEITYSYIIQFILYKVLIDNNYKKLKNDYEVFRGWVRTAVQTQNYGVLVKDIKKISEYIYKNVYEPFRQKQEGINRRLIEQLPTKPALDDIAPWLDIIMFIDRYNFAGLRNEIFGFVYENYLKELYHNENKGQYFTDPAVVNFMLEELGYTAEALAKTGGKNISIIDPSCGAGTFLYSATLAIKEAFDNGTASSSKKIEELVNKNIFGLDIEEFPLFLAEMNILMQLLPIVVNAKYSNVINDKIKLFITKDSIAEFLDTPINTTGDNAKDTNKGLFDDFDKSNTPPYMRNREDIMEMFNSLEEDLNGRKRFDYVIGNPPYIGYNKCTQVSFAKKIKDTSDPFSMGNVYGVNLHSVPGRRKPYPPKPNLYAFFIALGLGLLKDNGKICYIIPQTILTAGDLDVLRYHLAKYTTIEKIITFEGNLFIGRGIKQTKPVPTSSLIFVVKKASPQKNHNIRIVNYKPYTEKQGADFDAYFRSRNKESRNIPQIELLNNLDSWTFIKQSVEIQQMAAVYKSDSLSIEEWRRYVLQDYNEFNFDVGFILDQQYYTTDSDNNYPVLDFTQSVGYTKMLFGNYYPKNRDKIQLTRNSRYATLDHQYNIVCRIKNFQRFMLIDEPIIFNMGQAAIVATDNKEEALFLFALLNAQVNISILENNCKTENEKEFLVSIKTIKQYIRIPKITDTNAPVKNEIIKQTEALLDLEKPVIKDFVDFPATTLHKFDYIRVVGNAIVLTAGDRNYTAKIKPNKVDIVSATITAKYFPKDCLVPSKEINLEELRFLPAIDVDAQARIKAYIDDLVFALYFNVPIRKLGLENASGIHATCEKNEFYALVNTSLKEDRD
jgi:hypothetical protein